MSLDLNTKKIAKNAYRITKVRNKAALRLRVPGGHLDAVHFTVIKKIAEKYGDGSVHLTTRQGFEIPGIAYEHLDEINALIAPYIKTVEVDNGVRMEANKAGYPAAGTRNIAACIGNRVCPFANIDTTALALKIEKNVYPNNFHVKIAVTGCPNDCIKGHLQDFGVIGMVEPVLHYDRCMGCDACVTNCSKRVTGALSMHNFKVRRDTRRCIGCGECVMKCPTGAWARNPEPRYRLVIMGRTGKVNPRLARPFAEWLDEEAVLKILTNTYTFIEKHIDTSLPKEHVGYIVDRVGYRTFREEVLKDVTLPPGAKIAKNIQWGGYRYEPDTQMQ